MQAYSQISYLLSPRRMMFHFLCAVLVVSLTLIHQTCYATSKVGAGAGINTHGLYNIEDPPSSKPNGNTSILFDEATIPFLAPVYRNVSAGAAWVLPTSSLDLTFRSLDCECFDPAGTCGLAMIFQEIIC